MKRWFINKIMRPFWIVNAADELGIRVFGINLWYYKWSDPLIAKKEKNDPDSEYDKWRIADKREFGEVILSAKGFNRDKA